MKIEIKTRKTRCLHLINTYIYSPIPAIAYIIKKIIKPESTHLKENSNIEYFIHITDSIDEILKDKKILFTSSNIKNHSNNGKPAIYGYYKIPNKFIFPSDTDTRAIKIKLNDKLKKIAHIRKFDNCIYITQEELNKDYLILDGLEYEVITIKR